MRATRAGKLLVHHEVQQHRCRQEHEAEVGVVALEDTRQLRIGQGHHHARAQQHHDDAHNGARQTLARAHPQDTLREREHPQHRQAREDTDEGNLLDGLPHIGSVEGGRLQKGKHAGHAGRLEEVGEERRRQAPRVHATLGHIVHGEVVVRPEVGERPEPRVVVAHDARRDHYIGCRQAGELPRAGCGEQAPLGDVGAPEQREGQKRQHEQLRSAACHKRHA